MQAGKHCAVRAPSPSQEVLATARQRALARVGSPLGGIGQDGSALVVALVNNMPDGAFQETEHQFAALLCAAAPGLPVKMLKYWIPGVPRGPEVRAVIATDYLPIEEIYRRHVDALIVTGTEPSSSRLSDEPYFTSLCQLLRWAEANVRTTILSCLAAHVAVLLFDGLERRPLPSKATGVFRNSVASSHSLTRGLGRTAWMPHSRLNDVDARQLQACGYQSLLWSANSWTAMSKLRQDCLFLLYQGHPEYGATTLLREHRRDVRRYLRGETVVYPARPIDYFDAAGEAILAEFEGRVARRGADEELLGAFPMEALAAHVNYRWNGPALGLYRNWLRAATGEMPSWKHPRLEAALV